MSKQLRALSHRLAWRDSLLGKYERRIRELEDVLRLALPFIVHPEREVTAELQKVLDKPLSDYAHQA